MSKKICIFSANYLPNTGGVERYTYYLAKELIRQGHKVTVVTSNVFQLPEHEIIEEIEIYRLACLNLLNGRFPVLKFGENFRKINKELKTHSFDFVIVNTRFYLHSLYGVFFAKKNGVKCITIEHGTAHLTVDNKFWDAMGQGFEHFITLFIKHYCKNFYGVSQAACDWSAHFKIKSKGVLFNSVDLNEIKSIVSSTAISYKQRYALPQNAYVVTFTGRLVKEKGVLNLITAFKELALPDSYLFIAGDGPLDEQIKKENSENKNILPLGKIDFQHVISLLSETDVFCLPSESEGLSTSVLEAVASKAFVITTSHGGSKELVAGEDYGIIMEGNSVEEIKNAALKVYHDRKYHDTAIQNCYERLKEDFVWEKTAKKVLSIID